MKTHFYTLKDLQAFGESELIQQVLDLQTALSVYALPCYECGTLVSIEKLDEYGAYTIPENKPFCLNCAPPPQFGRKKPEIISFKAY